MLAHFTDEKLRFKIPKAVQLAASDGVSLPKSVSFQHERPSTAATELPTGFLCSEAPVR